MAHRAAFRCSAPHCDRLTVGPGLKPDQVEKTGQAAHIYSASELGPRGQGGLEPEELKDASNGIWMCGHHSDLIDKNTGVRYPATVLKSWKALHEFRIAYEHSGRTNAFGFIRELRIERSALFEPGTTVELGKTTFLIGGNSAGKTALCQWFSVIDSPQHLSRWLEPTELAYTIEFDVLSEHRLAVRTGDGKVQIKLNETEVAFNHHRVAVVFVEDKGERKYRDDLQLFSDVLKLDPVSVRSLAGLVTGLSFVESAEFVHEESDEGEWQDNLYCRIPNRGRIRYRALSGGERSRVLLEFAISQARSVSTFAPALLIMEWNGFAIDEAGFEHYTTYLSGPDCPFQTIITRYETTPLIEGLGWQTYRIARKYGEVGTILPAVVGQNTAFP